MEQWRSEDMFEGEMQGVRGCSSEIVSPELPQSLRPDVHVCRARGFLSHHLGFSGEDDGSEVDDEEMPDAMNRGRCKSMHHFPKTLNCSRFFYPLARGRFSSSPHGQVACAQAFR